MSKHTYLGARIPIELIANTYLYEIGSHFPKWPTKVDFFNISASSSLGIVILVSKHTFLGARIPMKTNYKHINTRFAARDVLWGGGAGYFSGAVPVQNMKQLLIY